MSTSLSATGQPETPERRAPGAVVLLPLSRPFWSWVILGINVVIWLVMIGVTMVQGGGLLTGSLGVSTQVLVTFGAKVNQLIASGQYWRLLTANFLHVNLFHLLFNTYALWQLGPEVERTYGRTRFLVIYLLAGLYGTLTSYAFGSYLSAGASAAIFGLVGTLVAYFLRHQDLFGRRGRAYLSNMIFIVAINLFIGVSTPGIDNWGHIGGLVAGFLLGYGLVPVYALPRTFSEGPVRLMDVSSRLRHVLVAAMALLLLVAITAAVTVRRQDSAALHVLRAQQALEAGDLTAAEDMLTRAVQKDPESAQAHFYLGVLRAQQGRVTEAAAEWERAAALDPEEPNTAWNLALAYQALGRRQEAIAQLQRYLTLIDDEASAQQARQMLKQLQQGR